MEAGITKSVWTLSEPIDQLKKQMLYPCPCCGYLTLPRKAGGTYELCPTCFWEDDGVQLKYPNYEGGANVVSLRQAQNNFVEFGASEKQFLQRFGSRPIKTLKTLTGN